VKRVLIRVLIALAIVGLAVGGYFLYGGLTREPETTYRTAKVEKARISAKISATGTLSAHVTVLVGSQVSGRVTEIGVDFNSPVKKGQRIARIDPQLYTAALSQARANAYAAQGNLTKAKAQALDGERQLARSKALRAEGIISQVDVDAAETNALVTAAQIDAAKGAVEQARAQVETAQANLAYTDIISPIDGVVISRAVDVGQTVAASLSAPTLFTIAQDLRQMQVDTSITEGDVGKLKAGMATTFVVDAYPSKKFKGTIRQIRNAPVSVQNVVTYDAVIDVDNPDLELKPGMTANASVVYSERIDVLAVPNAALRFRPPASLVGSASAAPSSTWGGAASSGGGRGRRGAASAAAAAPEPPVDQAASAKAVVNSGPLGSVSPLGSALPAPATTVTSAASGDAPAPRARGGRAGDASAASGVGTDRRSLWVMRGTKPVQVQVRTGLTDGTVTEILEGDIHEGDLIVTEAVTSTDDAPLPVASSKPAGGTQGSPRMRF
jgi:HlyD family secretion protein